MNITISIQDLYNLIQYSNNLLDVKVESSQGYNNVLTVDYTAKNSYVYLLKIDNGTCIKCSKEHLFFTNKGILSLKEIMNLVLIDNILIETKDGFQPISSISLENEKQDLLDIHVSNSNDFYANDIHVHNSQILNGITYTLFGKSLGHEKEKHSDNNFINNKRNLDYCIGRIDIEIDNKSYRIIRRTERKWNRTKTEIKQCPTYVEYYELDDDGNIIINNNEELAKKTAALIEERLGSFDDFLRTSFVNADTLNNLLSMDRAVFLDSLLRDCGLDIFDKKLSAFKAYKKNKYDTLERIKINVDSERQQIKENLELIAHNRTVIENNKSKIKNIITRIENGNKYKDSLIKKLHILDDKIINLNVEAVKSEIYQYLQDIESKKTDLENLTLLIESLPSEYDSAKLLSIQTDIQNKRNYIKEKNQELKNLDLRYYDVQNQVAQHNTMIQKNNNTIVALQNTKNNRLKEIDNELSMTEIKAKTLLQKLENEIQQYQNDIIALNNALQNTIQKYDFQKQNILDKIDILEKSKICKICNFEMPPHALVDINNEILQLRNNIDKIEKEKDLAILHHKNDVQLKENKINSIKLIIKNKQYMSDIEQQNAVLLQEKNDLLIPTNKYDTQIAALELKNKDSEKELILLQKELSQISIDKAIITENIDNTNILIDALSEEMTAIEDIKKKVEKRNSLIINKDNIPLLIENIEYKIKDKKNLLTEYEFCKVKIEENKKTNLDIEKADALLNTLIHEKETILEHNAKLEYHINSLISNNQDIESKIEKFNKQEIRDMIFKSYERCMHRDGIPKMILLQNLDFINDELHSILSQCGVDFTAFFDKDLNLKMCKNDNPQSVYNATLGSGKERTFISVCLRFVLRKVNNNKRYNILLLDEVMGKLVEESVNQFVSLLELSKKEIDIITIIEHAYSDSLQPDHLITIKSNELGISQMIFNY